MMRARSGACAALLLLWACGEDDNTGSDLPSGAMYPVLDASVVDGSIVDATVSTVVDGNSASQPGKTDASTKSDADVPSLMLEIPKAEVPCGSSTCTTLDNVCCEAWSQNTGFSGTQECITLKQCHDRHKRSGLDWNDRSVPHECDGKEDCSGGQVCCFYADSAPLCDFGDANCLSNLKGPGAGRICLDPENCVLAQLKFVTEGVPLGIASCNDDSDCADKPGTTCQPEQSNSLTTGPNVMARSYVRVCR